MYYLQACLRYAFSSFNYGIRLTYIHVHVNWVTQVRHWVNFCTRNFVLLVINVTISISYLPRLAWRYVNKYFLFVFFTLVTGHYLFLLDTYLDVYA